MGLDVRKVVVLMLAVALVGVVLGGCSSGSNGSTGGNGASSGSQSGSTDGATLVNDKCVQCHSLDRVQGARKSKSDWEATVSRMESNGLQVTSDEKTAIVEYLATTYGQ